MLSFLRACVPLLVACWRWLRLEFAFLCARVVSFSLCWSDPFQVLFVVSSVVVLMLVQASGTSSFLRGHDSGDGQSNGPTPGDPNQGDGSEEGKGTVCLYSPLYVRLGHMCLYHAPVLAVTVQVFPMAPLRVRTEIVTKQVSIL